MDAAEIEKAVEMPKEHTHTHTVSVLSEQTAPRFLTSVILGNAVYIYIFIICGNYLLS